MKFYSVFYLQNVKTLITLFLFKITVYWSNVKKLQKKVFFKTVYSQKGGLDIAHSQATNSFTHKKKLSLPVLETIENDKSSSFQWNRVLSGRQQELKYTVNHISNAFDRTGVAKIRIDFTSAKNVYRSGNRQETEVEKCSHSSRNLQCDHLFAYTMFRPTKRSFVALRINCT